MTLFLIGDLEQELENDPDVQRILAAYARAAVPVAKAFARADADTGAFGDSIQSDENRLYADDPGAVAIEFGSVHTRPKGTLRKAAEAVGGKIQ